MAPTLPARPRAFALSWLAYASYYLGRKGLSVTKARLCAELGLGTPLLALLDTVYLAAYAFGQVPSGLLADRIGARRLLALGMGLSACACFVFGSASTALPFVVCFVINGFAQSSGWPGSVKVMAEHTTLRERGRVMGVWSTCYQVGGIAATAFATWLLSARGWRAAFHGPALALALIGLLVFLGLPRTPSAAPVSAAEPTDPPSSTPATRDELRALLANPLIYSYGACYFCLKLIRYSLLFWLPYYLHAAAGFDEAQSGYLSTSFEIGGVVGSIGLGLIADRFARARAAVCVASIVLLAAAMFVYARLGAAPAAWHFTVMSVVGMALFGPDALLSGVAAQDLGGARAAGTAAGLVNGMGSFGALCQGALTVAVQQAFGWNALFYALFLFALCAALALVPALRAPFSESRA